MPSTDSIAPPPLPDEASPGDAGGPAGVMPTQKLSGEVLEVIDSVSLFEGRSTVQILHRGALYQLRATRQGKLILTK